MSKTPLAPLVIKWIKQLKKEGKTADQIHTDLAVITGQRIPLDQIKAQLENKGETASPLKNVHVVATQAPKPFMHVESYDGILLAVYERNEWKIPKNLPEFKLSYPETFEKDGAYFLPLIGPVRLRKLEENGDGEFARFVDFYNDKSTGSTRRIDVSKLWGAGFRELLSEEDIDRCVLFLLNSGSVELKHAFSSPEQTARFQNEILRTGDPFKMTERLSQISARNRSEAGTVYLEFFQKALKLLSQEFSAIHGLDPKDVSSMLSREINKPPGDSFRRLRPAPLLPLGVPEPGLQ